MIIATMTDQAVDFLKSQAVPVERILGLQGDLTSAAVLRAQNQNLISSSSAWEFKARKTKTSLARRNFLLVSDGNVEEGWQCVSKEELGGIKDALRVEEKRFVELAARFNQEIESLEREEDGWGGENGVVRDGEGDVGKRLEEVMEEINRKEKLCERLQDLEADCPMEDVVMEENKTVAELEVELEQERLSLQQDQASCEEDVAGYVALKELLGQAKAGCGTCSTYETVAVGRDSMSVRILSIMDGTSFSKSQVLHKYIHTLTLGLEVPLDASSCIMVSSDAVLDPPDISTEELQQLLKHMELKSNGAISVAEFIACVSRLLSSKLIRKAALHEAEKYSLRSIYPGGTVYRAALPCGVEVEMDIPSLWPSQIHSRISLLSAQAAKTGIDLTPAVREFQSTPDRCSNSLENYLSSLEAFVKTCL